jgi:hypothetical protein
LIDGQAVAEGDEVDLQVRVLGVNGGYRCEESIAVNMHAEAVKEHAFPG